MSGRTAAPPSRRWPRFARAALLLLVTTATTTTTTAQRAGNGGVGGYREAPAVNIRGQGAVSGVEVPLVKIGSRAWTYLGVPYARPPLGDLRFAPPDADPPPAWHGLRNGSVHAPACIQRPPARRHPVHQLFANVADPSGGQIRTSEDCLYLNVYRPEGVVPEEKFTVMVWFHPGDFQWGAPMYWDASVLAARNKVIVVTVAYRLNILGFYTDNTAAASGNWGLLDQAAALEWVQRNIDSFGGSARNVTVFGQGSGAVSVGLHVLSPGSRDKFQRAISMSGNALLRGRAAASAGGEVSEAVLDELAEKFTCFRGTLTGCLRNVDARSLVEEGGLLFRWGPVIDGPSLNNNNNNNNNNNGSGGGGGGGHEPFLPDAPAALMEEGRFAAVAYMIGYNRMEDAFDETLGGIVTGDRFEALVREAVVDDSDDLRRVQRRLRPAAAADDATALQDGGGGGGDDENCTLNADFVVDTIALRYAWQTDEPDALRRNYVTMSANKVYGASAHRVAGYASRYNATTYVYRYDYKLRTAKALPAAAEWMDAPHGAELPMVWGMPYWPAAAGLDWTAVDRRMSDTAMAMWTDFAKHADPARRAALPAGVRWDEYRPNAPRAMIVDKVPNVSAPDQEPEFWNEYYPKALAVSLQCCANYTAESAAARPTTPVRFLFGSGGALLLLVLLLL